MTPEMTPKQAIDRIDLLIGNEKLFIKISTMGEIDHSQNIESLEMAKQAVEKQIPKKPDTETINRGIDISGEYEIYSNYICPNCKNVVGDYENEEHYYDFCPDCGQALDWSED